MLVYLDSADFIDFADGKHQETFDELQELKKDGKCTFVYSYLHVMETLAPDAREYLQDRQNVGRIIKKLCGQNALPFLTDYLEGESLRQDGLWAPLGFADDLNFDNVFREAKSEIIDQLQTEGRINRYERRRLKTDSGMKAWISENGVSTAKSGSNHGFDLPHNLLYDKAARKAFKIEYELRLFDPERYSRIVFDLRHGDDPLRQLIKGLERPMFDAMKRAVETVKSSKEELRRIENELTELQSSADSASLERHPDVDSQFSRIKSAKRKLSSIKLDIPPPLPGADDGLLSHFVRIMLAGETPPKALSQITDIFHLYYHPACSLMRVDSRTFEAFKGYAPLKDKMVRTIAELPEAVRTN